MNIENKKISILGAVRSGIAAAKLAKQKGAIPFVSDLGDSEELRNSLKILSDQNIEFELGEHSDKVFDCDLIITSPGIPSNSKVIITAINKGIKVVSEIEFASWFCNGKVIAITGTNGKTTTTTLCAHVINNSGFKCYTAGNIGVAFSEVAVDVKEDEFVALEVSSFQLDFIDEFKPEFAIILNITPDHLDRYENRFDLYIKSKMRIGENLDKDNYFIYNGDDSNIPVGMISNKVTLVGFSLDKVLSNGSFLDGDWLVYSENNNYDDVCKVSDLSLKGEHNQMNVLAVVNVAKRIGINNSKITESLSSFKGVEHRLESVKKINGIEFINDSKATNVDAVWYALRSFENPLYLILGGKDKGNDYSAIKDEVKKRVKKIFAIGSSAQKIYDFFSSITKVEIVESLENAVNKGLSEGEENDVVLLSPACASFDMFKNYEDRGQKFKEAVNSIVYEELN